MGTQSFNKQELFEAKLKEIRSKESIGLDIDQNLEETIAILTLLDFPILSAGGGSIEYGFPAPWIRISEPGMPGYIFIREQEVWENVAKKHSISIKEAKHDQKIWDEATRQYSGNDFTPEFIEYNKKNGVLYEKFEPYLVEFYKNRSVAENIKIILDATYSCGWFEIHNGGHDWKEVTDSILSGHKGVLKRTETEKSELKKRLKSYREEMTAFTEFLKNKYFSVQ